MELTQPAAEVGKPTLYSTLENVTIDSADRRVVYLEAGRFEAPNWMRDGSAFLFNRDGHIERLAVGSDKPVTVDTGFANRCNNDHGMSPDGYTDLRSATIRRAGMSRWFTSYLFLEGHRGASRRNLRRTGMVGRRTGRRWRLWDERGGDFDIYAIPAAGGDETRLTTAPGLDDGPEYSPDGKYIYFNSERTGHMQIWRMKADGGEQEQVSSGGLERLVPALFRRMGSGWCFLRSARSVTGHPENKDVDAAADVAGGQARFDRGGEVVRWARER